MPIEITSKSIRVRLRAPKSCAKGSFRTIKRAGVRIVVCCPKDHWKHGRCRVGMKAQSKITPRKRKRS